MTNCALAGAHWIKASASSSGNGCVEVAHLPGGRVALRDSKDITRPAHIYSARAWDRLLSSAKLGQLDRP